MSDNQPFTVGGVTYYYHHVSIPPTLLKPNRPLRPVSWASKSTIPVILVTDMTGPHKVVTHYILGENEIDFKAVYTEIKSFQKHPGRGRVTSAPGARGLGKRHTVQRCKHDFMKAYWNCFARIVDYFADFARYDTALMQSLWFHLVDCMQKIAGGLPHGTTHSVVVCDHYFRFNNQYAQTLKLIDTIITGRRPLSSGQDKIVVPNFSLPTGLLPITEDIGSVDGGECRTGFKAGLKPWQQFLYNGAPGFAVDKKDRVHLPDDVYERKEYQSDKPVLKVQHVPWGGLAIISTHTEKNRQAMLSLAQQNNDDDEEELSEVNLGREYDRHSLKMGETFSYASPMTGRQTTVQQMTPKPTAFAPKRAQNLEIPIPNVEAKDVAMHLLDDSVGTYIYIY
ncbi:hypothetical protein K504DRAFT_538418 [Pleomassaria siparia CBS 279.74]|uniref:Uncharacterized protein n=1 Tax=Pleomassaria siparia CBS 279.74 TaxID=1314801 RepID=A0A6G1JTX5_9PLEO|nr:hypothetical protein K504DRAFT_538418 [Pleomassaria siparia CBS 279.74]